MSQVAIHRVSCLVRMQLTLLLDSEVSDLLLLLVEVSDLLAVVVEEVALALTTPLDPEETQSVALQEVVHREVVEEVLWLVGLLP